MSTEFNSDPDVCNMIFFKAHLGLELGRSLRQIYRMYHRLRSPHKPQRLPSPSLTSYEILRSVFKNSSCANDIICNNKGCMGPRKSSLKDKLYSWNHHTSVSRCKASQESDVYPWCSSPDTISSHHASSSYVHSYESSGSGGCIGTSQYAQQPFSPFFVYDMHPTSTHSSERTTYLHSSTSPAYIPSSPYIPLRLGGYHNDNTSYEPQSLPSVHPNKVPPEQPLDPLYIEQSTRAFYPLYDNGDFVGNQVSPLRQPTGDYSRPSSNGRRRLLKFWRRAKRTVPQKIKHCVFENLGNTCYMGSALQCLISTKLLSDYFYYGMHLDELQPDNDFGSGGVLTNAFVHLIKVYRECSETTSLDLSDLKRIVASLNPMFDGYEEHDAQEFLAFMLDTLHEDLNRASRKGRTLFNNFPEEPTINRQFLRTICYETLAAASWQKYLFRNQSVLVDLFQGQLESRLTCLQCKDFSLKFEPFMYLSLPVKSHSTSCDIRSIEDAFVAFCSPERLKDSHWKCPDCKEVVPVEKRITVLKLPPVLIIHFKRLEFNDSVPRKIENFIHVALQGMNLQHISEQKQELNYDLYAVIDHSGRACSDNGSVLTTFPFHRWNPMRRDVPQELHFLNRQNVWEPEKWPHSLSSHSINFLKHNTACIFLPSPPQC